MSVNNIGSRWSKRLLFHLAGGRVMAGPFAGLRYGKFSVGSAYGSKLLGTYELELIPLVRRLVQKPWDRVVDIGAAEGYYAVGWARFGTGTTPGAGPPVTAFEVEADGRAAMLEMARRNGVETRLSIRGRCEPADLRACLAAPGGGGGVGDTLVICDVEGYEEALLDPATVPALTGAHILVEVHDFAVAGVGEKLSRRFAPTHDLVRVEARERSPADCPANAWWAALLPGRVRGRLLAEHRPPGMYWYLLEPKRPS